MQGKSTINGENFYAFKRYPFKGMEAVRMNCLQTLRPHFSFDSFAIQTRKPPHERVIVSTAKNPLVGTAITIDNGAQNIALPS